MPAHQPPLPPRLCAICGEGFQPDNSRHSCCGAKCQRERKRRCCRVWYAQHAEQHIGRVMARKMEMPCTR